MQCPVDNATLVMSERSGIEIDYCPECRGVWFDRGELDKLIERSAVAPAQEAPSPRDDRRDSHDSGRGKPRKREGWLSEFFD